VGSVPERLTRVQKFEFPLANAPDKLIGFVTGDHDDIRIGDVWVSSENTNMQMDSFFGKSTSATIRYLGARKDHRNVIVEDTIADELRQKMDGTVTVDPATVIATGPGSLARNGVKWIFHVASVMGQPREGYRPVQRIDQCVKNALRHAGEDEYQQAGVATILFPILGTGPAAGRFDEHTGVCVRAAVDYLESTPTPLRAVYFNAWSNVDLETCLTIAGNHSGLKGR
jgi:O-acetyl-ADP-ribose deacetylase (regulator of RNase III)